jgi:hypothetical protein
MKQVFIFILILILTTIVILAYFNLWIFKLNVESKYTESKASSLEEQSRIFRTPYPQIRNPLIRTEAQVPTQIPLSQIILPIVQEQAEQGLSEYRNCLNCEYKQANLEICEDYVCNPVGRPTNEMNWFFCNNPYINNWNEQDVGNINDIQTNLPTNIPDSEINIKFYNIWRSQDKYKKNLVKQNNNCSDLLDNTRQTNINIMNQFLNEYSEAVGNNNIINARQNPTDMQNGIPSTQSTIEDYIFNSRYVRNFTDGYEGFNNDFRNELKEITSTYHNPEVDRVFDTCFGIYRAPTNSPTECPLDNNPNINRNSLPPNTTPPIPNFIYGSPDSTCAPNTNITDINSCASAFHIIDNSSSIPRINPTQRDDQSLPYGCGLENSDVLIFNNNQTNNPNPSISPLCRRN